MSVFRHLYSLVTVVVLICLAPALRAQQVWQPSPQEFTTANLWGIAYGTDDSSASPTLIAVGERGTILSYAYANPEWLPRPVDTDVWLVGIGFGAHRFVVVGDRGTILTSDDLGATWTPRPSGTTTRLNAVVYGNGRWLIVGEQGAVLTSTDGNSWTARPSLGTGFLRALAFGQGRFLLGGAGGRLFTTVEAEVFTPVPLATTEDIEAAAISASRYFISGSNGLHASATQLSAWSLTSAGTTSTLRGLATHSTDDATAVGEHEVVSFRADAWRTSFHPLVFLSTAIARGLNEIVAVGFGGKIAHAAFDAPSFVVCEPFPNVVYGADARVKLVTDDPVLAIQWTNNGIAIPGATTAEFTLRHVTTPAVLSGSFTTAARSYGISPFTLSVVPAGRPEIIDPIFHSALPVIPDLIVPQSDGKLLVAGAFSVALPSGPTRGLARLNTDGSLDPSFRAGSGIPITASISGLAPLPDGRIYVWGTFTTLADQPRPGLARLLSDGSLDPSFAPEAFPKGVTRAAAANDSGVYVQTGRDHLALFGASPPEIIHLFANGARDNSFALAPYNRLIGVDAFGRILAINFGSGTNLVRYLPNGTRDASYLPTAVQSFDQSNDNFVADVITATGIYAATRSFSGYSGGDGFFHLRAEGGGDSAYKVPYFSLFSSGLRSFHFRPDGQLWQITPQSNLYTYRTYAATAFAPTGARDASLYATLPDQRFYRILASQSDGALLVAVANDNTSAETLVRLRPLTGRPGRLTNLAIRALVPSSLDPLIAGFVTAGDGTAPALVRAIGPALTGFGVADALPDPTLSLTRDGTVVATNDDWPTTLAPRFTAVGAFPLTAGSRDAALETDFTSGNYTAVLTPVFGAPGSGLVELFASSASPATTPRRFVNLSARGTVVPDRPLIAGFTVTGELPITILIRGIGPTLETFGVPRVLADPQLTLYRNGTPLYANDDWSDFPDRSGLTSATTQVGAFQLPAGYSYIAGGNPELIVVPGSKDAALLVTLSPGSYTAVITGANSTTGNALVEVYEVPQ